MPSHSGPPFQGSGRRDATYDHLDDLRTTSIFSGLSSLLLSDKFSDMTITCGGRTFKAHRAIVCPQSSFFDKAFSSGFKEASSSTINLPEDDPDVLQRLLQFLYTGNYDEGVSFNRERPSEVSFLSPEEVGIEMAAPIGVAIPYRRKQPGHATSQSRQGHDSTSGEEEEEEKEEDDDEYDEGEYGEGLSTGYYASRDGDYQPNAQMIGMGNHLHEPDEEYDDFTSNVNEAAVESRDILGVGEVFNTESERLAAVRQLSNMRQELFLHLRLFIMADKYDVPALKLLARERFYRSAEHTWEVADEFPNIVDEIYTNTTEAEVAMREIVCRLVGSRLTCDDARKRMEWVMKKHGDFAVGVMNYYIAHDARERIWI
ncbi:hypothetical protein CkaCkLH20_10632 [Colletotrichum karsti]|uniref:BTB domain-containing protein n=1 Tax=Colletotrichum karsti TaxID=1095194 RepID=A0A9P6HXL5_9PEZI|nr:uncharacterized protein CkaCkLH20_10632 [Colletotrichum karsti]KAF9872000.1 hypothetical protein CkaCkLH20_10632 [Colletotrichum karsti]